MNTAKNYQTEYEGPVGHERKLHKTHFSAMDRKLRETDYDDGYEWIELRPGRWRLVKKAKPDSEESQ